MKTKQHLTISHYRLDRRRFLAAAACVTFGRISWADDVRHPDTTRWAFVSDTHVPAVNNSANPPRGHFFFDPLGNTKKVLTAIAADPPAGIVITGDLARLTGEAGDYRNLADCLAALPKRCSVFLAFGNHDHRANFRTVFPKTPGRHPEVEDRHITIVDALPLRFILLDSLRKVNEADGELGAPQREWLKTFLAARDDAPTLIFLHHNLSPEGGAIADALPFFDIIRPARCVKAVVFGHSHVPGYALLDGIHLINLPAVAYSFKQDAPIGWIDATLTQVPQFEPQLRFFRFFSVSVPWPVAAECGFDSC